jgi:pyruvate,water dikinase
MSTTEIATNLIRWFNQVGINDVPLVGGKNASLGEMYRELTPHGIRIPNGFATTAEAYRKYLDETGLHERIEKILTGLNVSDIASETRASRLRPRARS